jgi:hypothetical protein
VRVQLVPSIALGQRFFRSGRWIRIRHNGFAWPSCFRQVYGKGIEGTGGTVLNERGLNERV